MEFEVLYLWNKMSFIYIFCALCLQLLPTHARYDDVTAPPCHSSVRHGQNIEAGIPALLFYEIISTACTWFVSAIHYTEKTIFPSPFTLNGIWSWWQFSFRFWTKWKSIWFKIGSIKLSPWSYPIQCERRWKYSFLSVG